MALADPAVVTIGGTPHSLTRVKQDGYNSEYRLVSATDQYVLNVRNTSYLDKKRGVTINRHNIDISQTIFPVAPATLSTVRHCYVVIENQQGDTLTDPNNFAAGILTFLTASSGANITKVLNFES
ncbi:coat protein [ssRNA phage Esthiorhiza.2_5]|uniref:Coat protein n=2 Tax=Leviviricetes TaxID=2842243 RepID=A0A8S5L316_9VIRU|nr:coat protein [ssRNA phage Esthiorhiza.2_5]QDH91424.1 MAG: hypothetical protein H2RhizoLitter491090_000003 [Leviviridae sp.]QDH91553.1 MAG: hypothetical protein H1RhizoLitter1273_000003 [Leviviridae sp.]DAD51891.1 TPA_asm: coat protein [ssRNA phage Esthiorhiza.2_5]